MQVKDNLGPPLPADLRRARCKEMFGRHADKETSLINKDQVCPLDLSSEKPGQGRLFLQNVTM